MPYTYKTLSRIVLWNIMNPSLSPFTFQLQQRHRRCQQHRYDFNLPGNFKWSQFFHDQVAEGGWVTYGDNAAGKRCARLTPGDHQSVIVCLIIKALALNVIDKSISGLPQMSTSICFALTSCLCNTELLTPLNDDCQGVTSPPKGILRNRCDRASSCMWAWLMGGDDHSTFSAVF